METFADKKAENTLKAACRGLLIESQYVPPPESGETCEAKLKRRADITRCIKTARERKRRSTETPEETDKRREADRKQTAFKRANETTSETALRRGDVRKQTAFKRANETTSETALRRGDVRKQTAHRRANETANEKKQRQHADSNAKRAKRSEDRKASKANQSANLKDDGEVEEWPDVRGTICWEKLVKDALGRLSQTRLHDGSHRARVCVICDCHIFGTATAHKVTKERLLNNKDRLGVPGYEQTHGVLDPELVRQYELDGYKGMLLSKRSRKIDDCFEACSSCFKATTPGNAKSNPNPPKFAIANGFAIGELPKTIKSSSPNDGEDVKNGKRTFPPDGISDVMSAAIGRQRPFAYTFAFGGGSQQSIVGHVSFFETDHRLFGGVMNNFVETGANPNILCVMCGRTTPNQRRVIEGLAQLNAGEYIDLINWYIQHHPAYSDVTPPERCPQPTLLKTPDDDNHNDTSVNGGLEEKYEGGTYTFTSSLDPSAESGLYADSTQFALAMLNGSTPKLLVYGGNYVTAGHELKLENVMVKQFPFGQGGPTLETQRRVPVSKIECMRYYLRHSLPQFKEGNFILVLNHMHNRIMTFDSGIITCRSGMVNGQPLAEQISTLTEAQIKEAVRKRDNNIEDNSVAGVFLKRVNASCKHIGYTKAAADDALRKMYALCDYFGSPDVFFSCTPDDECSFRVKLFAYPSKSHELPSLGLSEENCFEDFIVRRDTRLKYPGACSLEYQNTVQIMLEILFGWDPKKQCGKQGIFGKLIAYGVGHEEQGRKTLHGHWNMWIEGFKQLKDNLFHPDAEQRAIVRERYLEYVNAVMTAHYGDGLRVHHYCEPDTNASVESDSDVAMEDVGVEEGEVSNATQPKDCLVDDLFFDYKNGHPNEQQQLQRLRDARHKSLASEVGGKILTCNDCDKLFSPTDIINMALDRHKANLKADIELPLSKYRKDIATFRYSYDYHSSDGFDSSTKAPGFWGNGDVRNLLLQAHINEHDSDHRPSCFKKGPECRHFLPKRSCVETRIEDDLGDDGANITDWYHDILESPTEVHPYLIELRRDQGCQYLNTHSKPVSIVFCCNTNVQIGNPTHIFYTTNYSFKDTQKEDRERYLRIGSQVIRRLLRMRSNRERNAAESGEGLEQDNDGPSFSEGLSRILSGISANLSKSVCSSTLAHFIMSNKGSRFDFSHEFAPLLASQAIDVLDGKEGNFRIRRNFSQNTNDTIMWPDSQLDDYRYRHDVLEEMCYFQYMMQYEKIPKKFKEMKRKEPKKKKASGNLHDLMDFEAAEGGDDEHESDDDWDDDDEINSEDEEEENMSRLPFQQNHPGFEFSYLQERKHAVIPVVSLPNDSICRIEELEACSDSPSASALEKREIYAKVALFLFSKHRLQSLDELKGTHETYWDQFVAAKQAGDIWPQGLTILLNIEQRMAASKMKRARDPVSKVTVEPEDVEGDGDNYSQDSKEKNKSGSTLTLAHFDEDNERSIDDDYHILEGYDQRTLRSNKHLINRANIGAENSIPARIKPGTSLLNYENESELTTTTNGSNVTGNSSNQRNQGGNHSYPTLLTMISGALVGGIYDYTSDMDESGSDAEVDDNADDTTPNNRSISVPTLSEVANKIAKKEGKILDEKQYISYEIIACSFLLRLVLEGSDRGSGVGILLSSSRGEFDPEEKRKLIQQLKARGAQEQLIMYLSGFAGAGKSTCIKVAQRFCFEFCRALSIAWSDKTFFFTATTGSAASQFGGGTIHKAGALNARGVTRKKRLEWKDVRILVIDEISFFSLTSLGKLDKHLRRITGQSNIVYGGMSIIFVGDFHQLKPVKVPDDKILYRGLMNGLWEGSINTVIFLETSHRFHDDPEWGEILYRMWRGETTEEDIATINSRLVGLPGVEVPDIIGEEDDICFACAKNIQRNAASAQTFSDLLKGESFPSIDSDELPSDEVIIIEADIQSSTSSKSRTRVNVEIRDRIIATCGDASIESGNGRLVDPALKMYAGAHKQCTVDNDSLDKGFGNGTGCRVVGIKLKDNAPPLRWKNWDGKKVNCISARHVDEAVFQHYPDTPEIALLKTQVAELESKIKDELSAVVNSHVLEEQLIKVKNELKKQTKARQFKLKPKKYTATVKVNLDDHVTDTTEIAGVSITQLPVIDSDGITGHKLQGMSKDQLIIPTWSFMANWVYVVLSRVRTLNGLFLLKELPLSAIAKLAPPRELLDHERRLRAIERNVIERRTRMMAELEEHNDL